MKKLLTAIITIAMMASLFIPQASAAAERTFVQVQYATEGQITIDGDLTASEWDENSKLVLSATGTGASKMKPWNGLDTVSDIQFYYSWGDKGLYMAAKVIDSTPVGLTPNEDGAIDPNKRSHADHFQIALNPMGLIADEFQGLFFSFVRMEMAEGETVGDIAGVAHNWEQGLPGGEVDAATQFNVGDLETYGEEFEGKYTATAEGWNMELLLPFDLIASDLRTYDLDVETDSPYSLSMFDPKGENRALAWASAMIAYVDCELVTDETDGSQIGSAKAAGRTVLESADDADWGVGSYPLALKFNIQGQTPDEVTETNAPTTTDPLDTSIGTSIATKAPTTKGPEEDTKDEDATAAPGADTTDATQGGEDGGLHVGVIIGIVAAAVVVIAGIVAVVLKKKKK